MSPRSTRSTRSKSKKGSISAGTENSVQIDSNNQLTTSIQLEEENVNSVSGETSYLAKDNSSSLITSLGLIRSSEESDVESVEDLVLNSKKKNKSNDSVELVTDFDPSDKEATPIRYKLRSRVPKPVSKPSSQAVDLTHFSSSDDEFLTPKITSTAKRSNSKITAKSSELSSPVKKATRGRKNSKISNKQTDSESEETESYTATKRKSTKKSSRPVRKSTRVNTKRAKVTKLQSDSEFEASGVGENSSESNSDASVVELSDTESSVDIPLASKFSKKKVYKNTNNKYKNDPRYKQSWKYYQTHPCEDPRVLDIHPSLENVWDWVDKIPVPEISMIDQPADLKLKLLPFQREGVSWMLQQEQGFFKGGLLADEMGMGKTIQTIALLLSEPRHRPNLLIAPTVALMQWMAEIQNHTTTLKVLLFHGNNRTKSEKEFQNYDIILTTYSIIESSFRKQQYGFKRKGVQVKEKSIIHSTTWHRVILDEGHYIKDRACNTARATFALNAEHKWALSGTPLQNRVGELYSLIRFLRIDPFSYYYCKKCDCKSLSWSFHRNSVCNDCGCSPMNHFCWWNSEVMKPIQKYGCVDEGKLGFEKLGKILDRIMLRRTKNEKADDLGLPPRVLTVRRDVFNEEEEDYYESLYSDTKRKFTTYVEAGTVLNNYANIFELITKMRLAVNHPDLILKRLPTTTGTGTTLDPEAKPLKDRLVCVLCQDEAEDPILSKCKHVFCREDASQYLNTSLELHPKCPACYVPLTIDLTQATLRNEDDGEDALKKLELEVSERKRLGKQFKPQSEQFKRSIVNRIDMDRWRSSTKIEALVEELDKLRSKDYTIKSIVFSQFVNFLDLVHWRLTRAGFACCRLDGRMGPAQRDAVIQTFMQRHEYTVFLVSLKAGGIALNLTEASRVFLCDPWWNPAVEDQAMDRIHRLGQRRPIQVTRLIVENSIESRILELQKKKHAMFQSTIGKDTAALARLTEEDLRFLFVG